MSSVTNEIRNVFWFFEGRRGLKMERKKKSGKKKHLISTIPKIHLPTWIPKIRYHRSFDTNNNKDENHLKLCWYFENGMFLIFEWMLCTKCGEREKEWQSTKWAYNFRICVCVSMAYWCFNRTPFHLVSNCLHLQHIHIRQLCVSHTHTHTYSHNESVRMWIRASI